MENLIRVGSRPQAVLEAYRAVLMGIPEDQITGHGFAGFLMEKGYLPQAVAEYERRIARSEATTADRLGLTQCYRRLGLLSQALLQAETIVRGNPQNAQGWRILAEIRRERGETEPAWEAARNAFLYGASSPEIAMLYYDLRPPQPPFREFLMQATGGGAPSSPVSTARLSSPSRTEQRRPSENAEILQSSVENEPAAPPAPTSQTSSELEIGIERIVNLQRLGLYSDARRLGRDLFARYPNSVRLLNLMGVINYRLGDRSSAAANLRRSLELDPEQPVVIETLEAIESEMRAGL